MAGKLRILLKAIINRLTMNENPTKKIVYHQVRKYPKVGRNDECPCGSRQKYKYCCQPKKRNPWARARTNNNN